MKRRSAFNGLAGSFLLATLGGCGLLFDFDYHAANTTGSGGGSSTEGSGGSQGGSGGSSTVGTGGTGGTGGCLDTMSDPKNCGKCGWDCLGGDCVSGECQAVVVVQGATDGSDSFNHIAIDSTTVYWTTTSGKILSVAKKAPPMSAPVLSTPQTLEADSIAVDANNLYWSVMHQGMTTEIRRGPKTDPTAFTPVASMELQPVSLVLGVNLYWSDYNVGGVIRSATTTGDNLTDLVPQQDRVLFLLPAANDLYWSHRGATDSVGGIRRLVAGKVEDLAAGENAPTGIALDETYVYWVRQDGKVRRAPRAGGSPLPTPEDVAPFEGQIFYAEIAVDDLYAYWTGLKTVWRAPKDGSAAPQDFGGGSWASVPALKMDGQVIYWTTGTDARLMRKVKHAP